MNTLHGLHGRKVYQQNSEDIALGTDYNRAQVS